MQINRKTLDGLLTLSDRQLMTLIGNLAKNNGVDLSEFHIDPSDVQSVRRALLGITDEDIQRIVEQYKRAQNGGR